MLDHLNIMHVYSIVQSHRVAQLYSTAPQCTTQQGQDSNMMGKHLLQCLYFLLVGREHFAVQPGSIFWPLHVQQCINQLQSPVLGS